MAEADEPEEKGRTRSSRIKRAAVRQRLRGAIEVAIQQVHQSEVCLGDLIVFVHLCLLDELGAHPGEASAMRRRRAGAAVDQRDERR